MMGSTEFSADHELCSRVLSPGRLGMLAWPFGGKACTNDAGKAACTVLREHACPTLRRPAVARL